MNNKKDINATLIFCGETRWLWFGLMTLGLFNPFKASELSCGIGFTLSMLLYSLSLIAYGYSRVDK